MKRENTKLRVSLHPEIKGLLFCQSLYNSSSSTSVIMISTYGLGVIKLRFRVSGNKKMVRTLTVHLTVQIFEFPCKKSLFIMTNLKSMFNPIFSINDVFKVDV